MAPRMPVGEAVVMFQVVDQMFLETDGTTTDRRIMVLLPDGYERVGYKLSAIQCVTQTQNRTTNHRWNAELSISVNGLDWYPTTPEDLFTYVTADGQAVQAVVTDTTKFRAPYIRLNLATSNGSGAARESATVSLWLILIFQT